jgi:hypothetical protein
LDLFSASRFIYESEKDFEKEKKVAIDRKGKGAERLPLTITTAKEKIESDNASNISTGLMSTKKLERSSVMNLSKEVLILNLELVLICRF